MMHNRVHTGEKQNVCKSCGRTFNSVPGLQHHMYFHTGEKPYECKMCDKAYVLAENLKYHMMVHTGEKPYSCPHCDKKSRSKFDMECHIRIHTGEKPFKCDTCSKAFRNPRYLKRGCLVFHTPGYNQVKMAILRQLLTKAMKPEILQAPEIGKTDFDNLCLACLSKDCLRNVFVITYEGAALISLLEDLLNFHVSNCHFRKVLL
ncbi:Zinc finger protein 234-like Protein [Tribolium castaneum]|uniref:Zinc finger protein 234-like Protein n=1 Tax=Tribolium castaneum TaxID=7070 RepID=A0A139WA25_TRICA|nr:Zinc finger protein 234-like Protein [Tribolium castaneum]